MFAKEIYIARRKALLEKMAQTAPQGKRGIALFVGNVEAAAQYKDNAYKFRQDSSWLYFSDSTSHAMRPSWTLTAERRPSSPTMWRSETSSGWDLSHRSPPRPPRLA